jgi:CheY-like chemotaxis protein
MFYQNYLRFVGSFTNIVGAVMQDLARLMDDPAFAINRDNSYEMVRLREQAYGQFCAACKALGIALPPLEKDVQDYYLPKVETHAKAVAESNLKLAQEIRDLTDNELCRAIALVLETFSATGASGSTEISKKNLMAVVNRELVSLGQEPLRFLPDLRRPPEEPVFSRELKVLIVDDKIDDIFRTALSLAGWPKLKVSWELQNSKLSWDPSDEQKEQEVSRMVEAIVAANPDIVLMDQGLRGIDGASLVPGVRQALPSVVVIANTGGSADELHAAGAVSSANKGEKMLQAMREVAWHFCG